MAEQLVWVVTFPEHASTQQRTPREHYVFARKTLVLDSITRTWEGTDIEIEQDSTSIKVKEHGIIVLEASLAFVRDLPEYL